MKPSIFRRNLALIASVVFSAVVVFIAIAIAVTDSLSIESSSTVLLRTASLTASSFEVLGKAGSTPGETGSDTDRIVRDIARRSGYRVTLIGGDGGVLADSAAASSTMENHAGRPEIARALAGDESTSVRRSTTTNIRMLYAAVPLASPADGALRLAMPLPSVLSRLAEARWIFLPFIVFIAALSLIVSRTINRQIAEPVGYILEKAESYAKNAEPPALPQARIPVELRVLDDSLDDMVGKIRQRTKDAEELGRRYSSILEAAGEGVIATDSSLKILEANSAAAALFGVSKSEMPGKTILEALGNREVAALFGESRDGSGELFRDIRLFRNGERHIKVHTTVSVEGKGRGVVAVFSDITELKRLEAVRKDFVANVSHELRTPIQIIRGYAEILSGEGGDPGTMKKYLGLIDKNAQRMERIVSDLLTLARLENDPASWLRVETCDLSSVIGAAIAAVEPGVSAKAMNVETVCPEGLTCIANSGLVEQALVNLLDNAINYSPEASTISVAAAIVDRRVEISVADRGIGIPPADLSHIFERFYRVDKSRSKNTGGTGLGLAIVRHIATIHGGEVRAQSYMNEGSTFTLSLPLEGPGSPLPP